MSAFSGPVLLAHILLLSILSIASSKYILKKVEINHEGLKDSLKIFSHEEISKYDGSDPSKPIYLALKGVVFDVSKGNDFYGKGASYNVLAGKDCSRASAKMSLEPEDLNHDVSDLDDDTLKSLDEVFEGTYVKKYPIVGYMQYLIDQHNSEEALQHDIKQDL